MQDKTLKNIAFCSTIIGITLLYILSLYIEPQNLTIETEPGSTIKISGTVADISTSNSTSFIKLVSKELIEVTAFEKVQLNKGDNVEIIGTIDDKSILADKITKK